MKLALSIPEIKRITRYSQINPDLAQRVLKEYEVPRVLELALVRKFNNREQNLEKKKFVPSFLSLETRSEKRANISRQRIL